ncbi:MAG: hypothetical protein JWM50_66 [Microbacteriaceae bacterium]|jgi:hypothetical protein|nr:hypothetical protein [Mycetocola sp.]MCU1542201.1 hypothetical protein [Microbacteriaceae bacterium]
MSENETPRTFKIDLPPTAVAGLFADFASVWHTPNVFVMDFVALTQPPQPTTDESGAETILVPGQVVSRIRIPPEQVFELAKALAQQLESWERETGKKAPEKPLFGDIT